MWDLPSHGTLYGAMEFLERFVGVRWLFPGELGETVRNGRVKFFCTTAPGLTELFAQRVIETQDRHPKREMTRISPTDGGGFCTCERCQPLLDTDPHDRPNHARAILTFYNLDAQLPRP